MKNVFISFPYALCVHSLVVMKTAVAAAVAAACTEAANPHAANESGHSGRFLYERKIGGRIYQTSMLIQYARVRRVPRRCAWLVVP